MGTYSIGPCGCCGGCESLLIAYDWTGTASEDLDTGTTFLGVKAGWCCGPNCSGGGNQYITWTGDNTSGGGIETVIINFKAALDAGLWSGSTTVNLAAGWYSDRDPVGSDQIIIRVSCYSGSNLPEQTKQVMPGTQNVCASTNVGSVTIYQNGTFVLN